MARCALVSCVQFYIDFFIVYVILTQFDLSVLLPTTIRKESLAV